MSRNAILIAVAVLSVPLISCFGAPSAPGGDKAVERHAKYFVGDGFQSHGAYDITKEKDKTITLAAAVAAARGVSLTGDDIKIHHYHLVGDAAEPFLQTYSLKDVLKGAAGKTEIRPGDVLQAVVAKRSL